MFTSKVAESLAQMRGKGRRKQMLAMFARMMTLRNSDLRGKFLSLENLEWVLKGEITGRHEARK